MKRLAAEAPLLLMFALMSSAWLQHSHVPKPEKVFAAQTTAIERQKFRQQLLEETIEGALGRGLTAQTEATWEGAFWGMGLARYKSEATTEAIRKAFRSFGERSVSFQRAMVEVVYAVYPAEYADEIGRVMEATRDEKLFAMAAHYLLRTNTASPFDLLGRMRKKFPLSLTHPIPWMLDIRLSELLMDRPPWRPPVLDLLAHPYEKGKPVLFSLQRRDRRMTGLAVLRDASGRFVRTRQDSFFCVPQLALSNSNLPGYLTNGNTPQGILSVQGFATVENRFIGPTETIQMMLPVETSPQIFFHSTASSDTTWSVERYAQLLPSSWRSCPDIYESYYAGSAGRTEIIAHGTTIDPTFYRDEPFYPITPTLGCLCASETWSLETGMRVSSDQQTLVDQMKRVDFEKGYCVVVELEGAERVVSIQDVAPLLAEAERRLLEKK